MKTFDLGHDWYMAEKDTPFFAGGGCALFGVYDAIAKRQNGRSLLAG